MAPGPDREFGQPPARKEERLQTAQHAPARSVQHAGAEQTAAPGTRPEGEGASRRHPSASGPAERDRSHERVSRQDADKSRGRRGRRPQERYDYKRLQEKSPRLREKFHFAATGIWEALKSEINLRIHFCAAAVALVLCAILRVELWGWVCVLILIGLVVFAELFNTAIETVVNLCSPEYHELAKRAKDIAAGAVLVLAVIAAAAGLAIYIDAFIRLIG